MTSSSTEKSKKKKEKKEKKEKEKKRLKKEEKKQKKEKKKQKKEKENEEKTIESDHLVEQGLLRKEKTATGPVHVDNGVSTSKGTKKIDPRPSKVHNEHEKIDPLGDSRKKRHYHDDGGANEKEECGSAKRLRTTNDFPPNAGSSTVPTSSPTAKSTVKSIISTTDPKRASNTFKTFTNKKTSWDNSMRPDYSFDVDDTDHCETPLQAYRDLVDLLDKLATCMGKNRTTLSIYDPYYCDGGAKDKLSSLGFTNVINQNRDFYDDISKNRIPNYDVLITNPPYSGVHIEKLLSFARKNQSKPFLLLLPHFVYTKDYYVRALTSTAPASNNDKRTSSSMSSLRLFYLVPETRYSYIPPSWVQSSEGSKALARGKEKTAPFPSFWYCHVANLVSSQWMTETFGPSGMIRPTHHSRLRYAHCPKDIPRDFKGEFDTTKKRPNPKARKRLAKKRREATK